MLANISIIYILLLKLVNLLIKFILRFIFKNSRRNDCCSM